MMSIAQRIHNKVLMHPRFAVSGFADNCYCSILVSTCMTQVCVKRDGFRHEILKKTIY